MCSNELKISEVIPIWGATSMLYSTARGLTLLQHPPYTMQNYRRYKAGVPVTAGVAAPRRRAGTGDPSNGKRIRCTGPRP